MTQRNMSLAMYQGKRQFYLDLEVFVGEALGFADITAANKFRVENNERRIKLKNRAISLCLDFESEVSRIQKCLIEQTKKGRKHQN